MAQKQQRLRTNQGLELQVVGLVFILGALIYKSLSGVMSSSAEKKPLLENKEASLPNESAALGFKVNWLLGIDLGKSWSTL